MPDNLAQHVLERVARSLLAKEWPSTDALEKYLNEHPKADRRKHTVKKSKPSAVSSPDPEPATRRTKTELSGGFKPSAESIDELIEKHKSTFDSIAAEAAELVETFRSPARRPTDVDRMAEAYGKFSRPQKLIVAAGYLLGREFAKVLSKDEAETQRKYIHGWVRSSTSTGAGPLTRPEDIEHSSQELQGLASAFGTRGSEAPRDVVLDKASNGGLTRARQAAAKKPELVAWVNKMYSFQQAYFKHVGLKELVLYRGVLDDADGVDTNGAVRVESRELASFTCDINIARSFGRVIEFRVPAERVLASTVVEPSLGPSPDKYGEAEFIVLGASDLDGKALGAPKRTKAAATKPKTHQIPISDKNADWLHPPGESTPARKNAAAKPVSIARRVLERFARSFAPSDVPGVFWLVFSLDEAFASDIASGELKGLKGISGSSRIVLNFFNVGRDAMLVMPGKAVVQTNKLSRIMYDNPEYLVSNDLDALYRIWAKSKQQKWGIAGVFGNMTDNIQLVLKASGDKKFRDIEYLIGWGTLNATAYGSYAKANPPSIDTARDLARWYRNATIAILKENKRDRRDPAFAEALKVSDWLPIVKGALEQVARAYKDEGEWVVKNDTFKVPAGSRMLVSRPPDIEKPYIDAYLRGGEQAMEEYAERSGWKADPDKPWRKPWILYPGGSSWKYFAKRLDIIRQHNLASRYRISFVDEARFDRRRQELNRR